MFERLSQVLQRILDYRLWEVGVELAILWLCVYVVYRFVRGTRAAGALKGLLVILVVGTLGVRVMGDRYFPRLSVLYNNFLGFAAIALVVTFQPELRRALIRLGETPFFRPAAPEVKPVVEAIASACEFLSRNKFGAILAIERNIGLRELIESGRILNADVSADLLTSIFWPNSPLHDMAVVISGKKLVAAGVQFPLAEPGEMPVQENLGTRHRAAVGLARVSDALVVVVSEETGAISLADGRELTRWLTPAALAQELTTRLGRTPMSSLARDPAAEPAQTIEGEDEPAKNRRKPGLRVSGAPPRELENGLGVTPENLPGPAAASGAGAGAGAGATGVRERLTTFLVVTLVTLTIWLFAEAESLGHESVSANVEIISPDPARMVYPGVGWDGHVTVDLSGSRAALQRAQRTLEQHLKLPLPTSTGEGEQDVDMLTALSSLDALSKIGVTVESARPLRAPVLVQEIIARQVPIKPELRGVEVQGAVAITPDKAEVRLPRTLAARLGDSLEATARVGRDQLAKLTQPGPVGLQADVVLPESLAGERGVQLLTTKVSLAFSVKSTLTAVPMQVPVQVLTLPVEWGDWVVVIDEGDQRIKVTVSGPSDFVERLAGADERLIAVLSLSTDELARRITSKDAGFALLRAGVPVGLPSGVEVKADSRAVRFTVKRRGEP